MLLLTRAWRVEYGLAHNTLMLALLLGSREALAQPSPARNFRPLLCAALFAESLNAWLFGQAARPQDGIYFAGDDPVFQRINTITWSEIAVLFPLLILWMWHYTTARIDGASRT